jgi:hypothetical protein
MIRRLGIVTLWLLLGHAVAFGFWWTLLQVPESSTLMLAVSTLLALLAILVAAAAQSGAMGAWDLRVSVGRGLAAGARRASMALLAAAVFGLTWWLTGHALEWHARMSGEIDAALIARTGSPNTAWLHATLRWLIVFFRWAVGLSLAVSLLGALVADGLAALRRSDWYRRALRPRQLARITCWFVLLDALPWRHVYWRPAHLSLTLEPWFVGAKLAIVAVLMTVGWALILREGNGQR